MSGNAQIRVLMAADASRARDTGLGRLQWFLARELERRDFLVRELYSEDFFSRGPYGLRRFTFPFAVVREARRAARRRKPYDFAVVHEGSAAFLCLALRARLIQTRCVVNSQNPEQKVWERHLEYARRGLDHVPLKSRLSWPATRLWQSNLALRQADFVICMSTEDVQFIQQRFGVPTDRIARSANGVEAQFFMGPRPPGDPRILFLGSWLPLKGIHALRQALPEVLERNPNSRVTLLGLGFPEARVAAEFPSRVQGQLQFRSHFAPEELPGIVARHNIFVLPSWWEGMPLSLLEAMAAGLAPVVTSVGGMRDVVRDGVDGLCVPPDNASALAAALERMCREPLLRAQIGTAAQERARGFTWEIAGGHLAGILRALATSSSEALKAPTHSGFAQPDKMTY